MNLDRLKAHLRQAEGFRARPYLDTAMPPVWTIGYGHSLPKITRDEVNSLTWTEDDAEQVLDQDVAHAIHAASSFGWWLTLDDVRQACVVELVFSLGAAGFGKFVKTIGAIQNREYHKAARCLMDSKWAKQVGPARSGRLAQMLETGRDV